MKARVNGVERELTDGATVTDVLRLLEIAGNGVAVAVNGEVVPRAHHQQTVVGEGAEVEVLTAVQGG
ncbi:sulfur carrier protein ThiS [Kibdelosporangium philippinense]|uniref:Sulfur carrier protein ThiS n=1 Tax=Kibdelosporangium philippinense TaxID=211113 RepID=A0ABS8ZQF1_9PSEU|nr:sulfur carrier protein ThiS [Kibdelosporangium philippinense]MCE7009145.1 sulfur carrier protein ThiS [Kibdelosporangium philippinense]